jgi:2-polyprenyl-6-methoxyphenol hydroxylase-like FAD-dependent oxidoreductase
MNDVIIIGGSFAGLAGALQLGRARRKVTVLDTGLPRNRFAGHSHGLLGHDHKPPLDTWPRRGSNWRVIPRSGWSVPVPRASPAPLMISPSSLVMAKALGRAA